MRNLLSSVPAYDKDVSLPLTLTLPLPLPLPLASPAPSPSSLRSLDLSRHEILFFSSLPIANSVFDFATLAFVSALILLSLLSLAFVFHLHLRSRRVHHLKNFNSLWAIKLLLVSFAAFWAGNEILRLPFIRRSYLYPFLPSISLPQQANICKIHAVLSLGLFEPGFLLTLLFLVNASIKKRKPCPIRGIVSVFVACSPIALLQTFFVYFSPLEAKLSKFLHGSSVPAEEHFGHRTMLCTYPFFSCVMFSIFAIAYVMCFLVLCWRVLAFVINKTIRRRINTLSTMVVVALPVQVLCLSLSWLWIPEDVEYGCVVLTMFVCVACCMAGGEVILIIKPIMDALSAGENIDRWDSDGAAADRGGGQGQQS